MGVMDLYEKLVSKYGIEEKLEGEVLETGSLLLNRALTIGGYAAGRIVEIFGAEGAGKTTLGLHAMVEAQKKDWIAAIIDMECSFDSEYAKVIGLKGKRNEGYIHLVPNFGEEAVDMLGDLLDDNVRLIVIDSVASMVPKAEFEGETGEAFMGLQARMMGQALRKMTTRIYDAGAIVIFINQVRSKIGVFFGSPETTSGGRALPFYATQRIRLRGGEEIGQGEGKMIVAKVVKNKLGPPLKECKIPLIYGKGVDQAFEIFSELETIGRITKKSSFFYFEGDKLGNGRLAAVEAIRTEIKKYKKVLNECSKA